MGDKTVTKSLTTLNLAPPPTKPGALKQEQWDELRSLFPIYLALAKQLIIEIPFPQEKRHLGEKPELDLYNKMYKK